MDKMKNLPFGYLFPEEENYIVDTCRGFGLCIDLGTCNGRSAALMSKSAVKVITVDVFEDIFLISNEGSRAHYENIFNRNPHYYEDVKIILSEYPNVIIEKSTTAEYALTQKDNSVDLIFFDADHSFSGLKKEFNSWYPKIKIGGILIFHDAIDNNWDVNIFCDIFCDTTSNRVAEINTVRTMRCFKKV
jgi:hypothetical protein